MRPPPMRPPPWWPKPEAMWSAFGVLAGLKSAGFYADNPKQRWRGADATHEFAPLLGPRGSSPQHPRRLLRPVIGVPAQNRGRTIELLEQHDADELMRPGQGPEGERQVGLLA